MSAFHQVVKDLGLCVTLYEIVSIEGGTVYPGEGSARFRVVFRVVVFRPFTGEVLEGRLKKANSTGLHISIGFFEDIFIPEHLLQAGQNFYASPLCSSTQAISLRYRY